MDTPRLRGDKGLPVSFNLTACVRPRPQKVSLGKPCRSGKDLSLKETRVGRRGGWWTKEIPPETGLRQRNTSKKVDSRQLDGDGSETFVTDSVPLRRFLHRNWRRVSGRTVNLTTPNFFSFPVLVL